MFGKSSAKTSKSAHEKYQINTSKNRDYFKSYSVKRVQNKCKLFEGLRGSLNVHKRFT